MIGLDTNVLVRYISDDDPAQSTAAAKIIESLTPDSQGFVSLVVLAELTWVLQFSYNFNKNELITVIEKILRSAELELERSEIAAQALAQFRVSRADFSDCLIDRCSSAAGCDYILTFDKRAASTGKIRLAH